MFPIRIVGLLFRVKQRRKSINALSFKTLWYLETKICSVISGQLNIFDINFTSFCSHFAGHKPVASPRPTKVIYHALEILIRFLDSFLLF